MGENDVAGSSLVSVGVITRSRVKWRIRVYVKIVKRIGQSATSAHVW